MVMTINTPTIKFPYSKTNDMHSEQVIVTNLSRSISTITFPASFKIPNRKNCFIKQALPVQVETTPDGFLFSSGLIDEESFGTTYNEAVSDFLTSLCDHFQSLSRREKKLSTKDKSVLNALRSIIKT